jgi:hypothetical protein
MAVHNDFGGVVCWVLCGAGGAALASGGFFQDDWGEGIEGCGINLIRRVDGVGCV